MEARVESVQGMQSWERNCCYGMIIAEWSAPLTSIVLKLTLYRIWSRAKYMVEHEILWFLCKWKDDLSLVLEKSPR